MHFLTQPLAQITWFFLLWLLGFPGHLWGLFSHYPHLGIAMSSARPCFVKSFALQSKLLLLFFCFCFCLYYLFLFISTAFILSLSSFLFIFPYLLLCYLSLWFYDFLANFIYNCNLYFWIFGTYMNAFLDQSQIAFSLSSVPTGFTGKSFITLYSEFIKFIFADIGEFSLINSICEWLNIMLKPHLLIFCSLR
jgi:hypothetical protein